MLRNSNLFDTNGSIKITSTNHNLVVRFKGVSRNLIDCQDEINQTIADSMDDAIDYFCATYKVPRVSVTDKMRVLIRNKLCYQKELSLTQTSWGTLQTYENMLQKTETQLRGLIPVKHDKNNLILTEKNKLKTQLEKSLQDVHNDIDNLTEKMNVCANQLAPKITHSFLKGCYEKIHSNQKKPLYDLLNKKEQATLKSLNHSQKTLFEDMEYIHDLGRQINMRRSGSKDLENKLNVVMNSIQSLIVQETKECKPSVVEILDSWEDFEM